MLLIWFPIHKSEFRWLTCCKIETEMNRMKNWEAGTVTWRQWGFDVQQDERIPEKPKLRNDMEWETGEVALLWPTQTHPRRIYYTLSHITRRSFSKSKFHVTNHLTYLTSPPLSSRSLVFFVSSARSYLIYTVIRRYMSCCNCFIIFPQTYTGITVASTKMEGWLASL